MFQVAVAYCVLMGVFSLTAPSTNIHQVLPQGGAVIFAIETRPEKRFLPPNPVSDLNRCMSYIGKEKRQAIFLPLSKSWSRQCGTQVDGPTTLTFIQSDITFCRFRKIHTFHLQQASSRIMTICAFQLSKAVLFFLWLFVIGNVFPEDSVCVCIVF